MLPEDNRLPSRLTTGVHARAVAVVDPAAEATAHDPRLVAVAVADPAQENLARALRALVVANAAAADLSADLDEALLGGSGAPEALRRARALAGVVQRALAGALVETVEGL